MNSERDTHFYSTIYTCTNASFRYISHSFIQNFIKFIQFMFPPLNISIYRRSYCSPVIWEVKMVKDWWIRTERYTFVQLFLKLYKCVFKIYFTFFHWKLHKSPSIIKYSFIKYFQFFTFLSQSSDLGAKNGQRLKNSERDTHLYSSLCTCTNASFRCISNSFIQNCIKVLQFILIP